MSSNKPVLRYQSSVILVNTMNYKFAVDRLIHIRFFHFVFLVQMFQTFDPKLLGILHSFCPNTTYSLLKNKSKD